MSRIYEELRRVERLRANASSPKGARCSSPEFDRRRSPRAPLRIPVFVYGYLPGRKPFHEEAILQHVSPEGGLLILHTKVRPGQKLLLTNKFTQKEQKCFVIAPRPKDQRRFEVGVEFAQRSPGFFLMTPRK